jgi:hypothetical protein
MVYQFLDKTIFLCFSLSLQDLCVLIITFINFIWTYRVSILFLHLLLLYFNHALLDFLVITSISLCLSISAFNVFSAAFLMNDVAVILVLEFENLVFFFLFLFFFFDGVLFIICIILFDFINFGTLKVYQSISFVLFHLARNVFAKCASDFIFVIVHRISSFER